MYGLKVNGYNYEDLLTAAKEKKKLEAQFVSFFDKFDGAGEAWHEVWAGNKYFLLPAGGSDGQKGGYVKRLNEFPHKYLFMLEFFNLNPEYLPQSFDFKFISKHRQPHTENSLREDSGYHSYERWKRTIIKNEGINKLITQLEF